MAIGKDFLEKLQENNFQTGTESLVGVGRDSLKDSILIKREEHMFFKNLLLFLPLFIFLGCGSVLNSEHTAGATDTNGNAAESVNKISFSEIRTKILAPQCIQCHVQYGDYDFVKKDVSAILSSVQQGRMPKNSSPLSAELQLLLKQWSDAGAPNEIVADTPVTEPINNNELQATWDSLYKNIFVPKCVICHNPTGQAPWVDVSSRKGMASTLIKHLDFKVPENSKLILRLSDPEEPMPPLPPDSNIPQLTKAEINVVIDWIKAGIP